MIAIRSTLRNLGMSIDHAELGLQALAKRDWEVAEIEFQKALDVDPSNTEANYGMATMALEAGYPEDAIDLLANASQSTDQRIRSVKVAAIKHLTDASLLRLSKSGDLDASMQLGSKYVASSRWLDVKNLFEEVVKHSPDSAVIHGFLATAYLQLGRMEECRAAMKNRVRLMPDDPVILSQWIGLHSGKADLSAEEFLGLSRAWDQRFGQASSPLANVRPTHASAAGKIRVGFVSATFHHHANCQFLLPLLEAMNRELFQIFAYHDGSANDEITARCRSAAHTFRNVRHLTDRQAAELIRKDEIDVLVDINGHFDNSRLTIFTYRPAPVQVHYLGGTASTGVQCIDWRISDELIEPSKLPEIGTERIHRITGGIHSFHPLVRTTEPDDLPCLRNGYITFGSLNSQMKIEPQVLRLWGQCLEAVPKSRLRLVKEIFADTGVRSDFTKRAGAAGIPESRLELIPGMSPASYDDLSVYHGIDIALDTFPYNGITTTCQALWMGIPVVTLWGDRFVSREAAAIISRVGYPEWTADTQDDYVEIAKQLAADSSQLITLRRELRQCLIDSPLHDSARLAREMEKFFRSVVLC